MFYQLKLLNYLKVILPIWLRQKLKKLTLLFLISIRQPIWVYFSDRSRNFGRIKKSYSYKEKFSKRKSDHFLILVPWFVGGGSFTMTTAMIRLLAKRGFLFSVFFTREPGTHIKFLKPYVDRIEQLQLSWRNKENEIAVQSIISKTNPNGVILIDIDADSYFFLPYFKKNLIPIVDWLHFHTDTLSPYRQFVSKMGNLINHFVVVNQEMKKTLNSSDYLGNSGFVSVINNGVDTKFFNPKNFDNAQKFRIRNRIGILKEKPVVSYVSRFDDLKNPLGAVKIFEKILRQIPDAQLVMAGDGYLLAKTRRKVERSGFGKRIIFLDFQKDVRELLSVTTVLIAPSISESFGLSVAEAMTMEIPVVVSDVGGLKKLVVNGVHGYRVSPSDYDGFSKKTVLLLKNRILARSFGKAGRRYIRNNYPIDKMVDKFESLLNKISA